MKYKIEFTETATIQLAKLEKSEPKIFNKVIKLLSKLEEHPKFGTGKPEVLVGFNGNIMSRRLSKKHRLVYEIFEDRIVVSILSVMSHYGNK